MTRRKAQRAKAQRKKAGRLAAVLESPVWGRLVRIAARITLVSLAVAATYGSLEVKRTVEADPRFQLRNWKISFGTFPSWVTPRIQREIEALRENPIVGPGAGDSTVFHRNLLGELEHHILQNSWVHSVRETQVLYPGIRGDSDAAEDAAGELLVTLELRRPMAAVEYRGQFYLTDFAGVRLGAAISEQTLVEEFRIPAIVGTEAFYGPEPPDPGDSWEASGVGPILEGLEVARLLDLQEINQTFPRRPILMIDVRNVGARVPSNSSEIVLRAPGLPPLGWGRSPISERLQLTEPTEVIAKLKTVLGDPRAILQPVTAPVTLLRLDVPGQIVRVTAN